MNCQDITLILDERDINRLGEGERADVEMHLSGCPDCAAEWRVQQSLAKGFAPPVPAGLMERARALVAADWAGKARRSRSRRILIGTVVAMAAAAALLGWQLMTPATNTAAIEEVTALPTVPAIVEAPATRAAQSEPGNVDPGKADPGTQVPAQPPPADSFTVRVLPVLIEGDDPAGNALVQAYREKLIARLGKVPDLVLLDPAPRDKDDVADYDIRIKFKGDPTAQTHSAEIDVGKPAAVAEMARLAAGSPQERVEYTRRLSQALSIGMSSSAAGIIVPASVSFPTSATLNDVSSAMGPPGAQDFIDFTMDRLIQGMRVRIFPPNPSFKRELIARVSDTARPPGQRVQLLGDLLSMAESQGDIGRVDAATIRAGAELALTTTDERTKATAWEAMRKTKHPELVQYLVRGLDTERETKVRLQIIQILATEYGDNPQAKAALAKVSERETEPVVRMAALREVQGEAKWNQFAAATLRDASLPDLERLQPIADMIDAVTQKKTVNLGLSELEVRDLASVIMGAGHDDSLSNARRDAARNSLTVLAAMENPAVPDVLIDIMRMPATERGLAGISIAALKSTAMRAAATRYPGDAKVRATIEELANSPELLSNSSARMQLQMMDMNAQMEKARQQQQPAPPPPR